MVVRIRSGLRDFADWFLLLYRDYPVVAANGFSDFHVGVDAPAGLRRWWRPQAVFSLDGQRPFKPLPRSQAAPFFEWGLNWCVAETAHEYLIVHAAVVERHGTALVMPGPPGVGKSTLCAALVSRGWRLLSDELALIRPEAFLVDPLPRPMGLKNASIEVIRAFAPGLILGPECRDTAKGTVAHARVPEPSILRGRESARPGRVVFPRYEEGSGATLEPLDPGIGFRDLVAYAFNYASQGRRGFEAIVRLVEDTSPRTLRYGDLASACRTLERLVEPREVVHDVVTA